MVARPRHKLLNTAAAVAVAGAVGAAPVVQAVPAPTGEGAARATAPVTVRIGASDGFTRIEFAGSVGARAAIRQDGRTVVVRLGSTGPIDIARLRVDPPAGLEGVESRVVGGQTEIVLSLAETASARSGRADGAAYVNLYPPTAPGAAAPAANPVPASGVVPVRAEAAADRLTLRFAWASAPPAAVFRRGGAVWIVFDAKARLDMAGAQRALGPVASAQWSSGPDFTAVRLEARESLPVSAVVDGADWVVQLGGAPRPPGGGVSLRRDDSDGPSALVATLAGATRAVWLTDPAVGDRFAAVTARPPAKGYADARRTIDLAVLPSAQGLGIEAANSDLRIVVAGDLVRMTRPGGLTLSAPSESLDTAEAPTELPQAAQMPALVLDRWADVGHAGFAARYRQLQDAAAAEGAGGRTAPIQARLGLARFLIGSGLSYEAIGVLNGLIAQNETLSGEAEIRGLRGAARVSVGRLAEAQADFAVSALHGDPSAAVWRGYIAARQGAWEEARRQFAAGAPAIDSFPHLWRARFGAAHGEAALGAEDLPAARSLIAYALSQEIAPSEQLAIRMVQARLFEADGQTDRAIAVYQAVARAPLDKLATPAQLHASRLLLAKGAITPAQTIATLEPLRYRWRGDATELAVIRTLGQVYLDQGRYREALDALRGAGARYPDLPESVALNEQLQNAFRALFLDGQADGLQPIQAVALFLDFRDLTPVGADGDEMVRRLARRLVDVDLLDQAADMLKYQVENRLEGVAKASVATDLARIYLMSRKPEQALQAIWGSRTTLLPNALNSERRAIEARALSDLGRFDNALEVLGSDAGGQADDVRGEIAWKQQRWADAAALYERRLGDRWKNAVDPLSVEDESRLVRAGVGYSLAQDAGGLGRLSQRYGVFADRARAPAAVRIALAGPDESSISVRDITRVAGQVDAFAGWVASQKQRFRQRTDATRT